MNTLNRLVVWLSIGLMAAVTAVFFVGEAAFGTPLPAFDFMDFLIRTLPGGLITFGIDRMTDLIYAFGNPDELDSYAKFSEQLMAVMLFIGFGALIGWFYARLAAYLHQNGRFQNSGLISGVILGFGVGAVVALLSAEYNVSASTSRGINTAWIVSVFVLWGLVHNAIQLRVLSPAPATPEYVPQTPSSAPPLSQAQADLLDRRQFLIQVGGATAAITVSGAALGWLLRGGGGIFETGEPIVGLGLEAALIRRDRAAQITAFPSHRADLIPAGGTRDEYTLLENHYRIDINSGRAPNIEAESYRLEVFGLVESPIQFSLEELRTNYEPLTQIITLSCISNRVAGSLISTTAWTGIPMRDLLEDMQPTPEATYIKITSLDGFFELVSIADIQADERIMLTYDWDGVPLAERHGFPLRIYIPDRYGMKQPKWITRMEFVSEWEQGYWVRRGWDAEAFVRSTAVIDSVADDEAYTENGQTFVPIGGIAYAGARQISAVEIRVDNGEWVAADLKTPLSDTTWVVWRYDWPFEDGEHRFTVRCTEGDGAAQISAEAAVRPSGATGYHSLEKRL